MWGNFIRDIFYGCLSWRSARGADCLIVAAIGYSLDFYGFYAVIIGLALTLPYTAYMKIAKKEHVYPLVPFLTVGYIITLIILIIQGQHISWLL